MVKMMRDEIKHDPRMEQLFYQAVAEQVELETKLVKESKMEDLSLQSNRDKMLWTTKEMFYMLLIGMVIGFLIGVIV